MSVHENSQKMATNRHIWIYTKFLGQPITKVAYVWSRAVSALQYSILNLSPTRGKFFHNFAKMRNLRFSVTPLSDSDVVFGRTCRPTSRLVLVMHSFAVLLMQSASRWVLAFRRYDVICLGYNMVYRCCNLLISWPLTRWRLILKHIIVQTSSSNPWN